MSTGTPPWGTPVNRPEPGEPVYGAPSAQPARPTQAAGDGYVVLIEQTTGTGEAARWDLAVRPDQGGSGLEEARTAALWFARHFQPDHPMYPRGRDVFQVDRDRYLVRVPGATKTFHFTVTVARRLP